VKTKVDGVESFVPLADLVRTHQKDAAATQRLAEAERILQAAQQRAAQTQTPPADTTPAPAIDASEPEKQFLEALYSGDEEKTAQALKALFDGHQPAPPASPINADAIAAAVEQRLTVRGALNAFQTNFADIVTDPYLPEVADRFLAEETQGRRLEDLDPADVAKVLDTAGKRTRDWVTQRAAAVPGTVSTARENKLLRKQAIDEIPSVGATSSATTEPVPETPSQTIADMGRRRPGAQDF
jgi:hypothetical protein